MSDANLIKDKIREELEKGMPSKRKKEKSYLIYSIYLRRINIHLSLTLNFTILSDILIS